MSLLEILGLVALAWGGWFLWDNLRIREIANTAMREACRAEGLLFLDDTVGLESIRPVRDGTGRIRLRRVYGFEFSDTGPNRRKGSATLVGDALSVVNIGLDAQGETLH
jgi:hypothetical protein